MGAAFEHLVYIWSYRVRVANYDMSTPEIHFKKLYRTNVEATSAARECRNWSAQPVTELTVRMYHPDQEDGDRGVPTRMWRWQALGGDAFLPVPPEPLTELGDPEERGKMKGFRRKA